jgi:DNA-binding PadR family transcriptional regulator
MGVVDVSWMRGSSPLKGALLGLVLQHPGHGYDLANRLGRRLGPTWQIQAKSIYPMLQQLERAGLLSSERIAHAGPTGQRIIYHPTDDAERALTTWMSTFAQRGPLRGELQAKLAVARSEDVPQLLMALDSHERNCLALLAASSEDAPPVRSFVALAMSLTRTAALVRLRAELEWVRLARQALGEFTRSATPGGARQKGHGAQAARSPSAARRASASAAR